MKKSVCGLKQRIGGTMLYQKTTELVSNGVIGRRLLNVKEAAQYLGLEVDTVYRKSRLREVPCVKVGRALRFDMRALERYIEQHTIETID
ncbi:helix-turn-helix domain-containing protein [Granulicella arctica]|jgi:excisionase family DNA binding protein